MSDPHATKCNITQHALSAAQEAAVDLIVSGATDTAVAEALGVHRTTVCRWRISPTFIAAVNRRRADLFQAVADQLRTALPKAIAKVTDALEDADPQIRLKAAFGLLKLATPTMAVGPTHAEEIVNIETKRQRDADEEILSNDLADSIGLPPFDEHRATVWAELEQAASEGS